MLFERITYAEDFPINITIANIEEDPLHYHLDIEFVYVLKGEVELKNGYCRYTLRAGDIFTNSGHEIHGLKAKGGENAVALIRINTHYFSQYFPNLSTACYRTYSTRSEDPKFSLLRGLLLQILLKYSLRGINCKSECTYLMVDVIKHLDKYFNLFAFDKNVVVSFDKTNPVAIERISRICRYIYQYYAQNITLDDLSRMEHLSPFYISHLIKGFTGMNFRDFLCFARVEWSEIDLLGSDKKISQIAREVGFSTTAYYKKYFEKWFTLSPREHRALYAPLIKSDLRPALLTELPQNEAIDCIRQAHSGYSLKKDSSAVIENLQLELNIDSGAKPIMNFHKRLSITVTTDDYRVLGCGLAEALVDLSPAAVVLLKREGDSPEDMRSLYRQLRSVGVPVERRDYTKQVGISTCANDSIARAIYLISEQVKTEEAALELPLRDSGSGILGSTTALLTGGGIKKPSYFACAALSRIRGQVISRSSRCCVIRGGDEQTPVFAVLAYNANREVLDACLRTSDPQSVQRTINDFKDEVSISANINLRPGRYSVVKYSLTREANIFAYLSALGFQEETAVSRYFPRSFSCAPATEVYTEDVRTAFTINLTLKGAGIQAAIISPIKEPC